MGCKTCTEYMKLRSQCTVCAHELGEALAEAARVPVTFYNGLAAARHAESASWGVLYHHLENCPACADVHG